ncbi:MAG: endolytic transglycosylase MltG [Sphingomonadaceae bacterium]|nr:endolytic transglycosylase MltG [Sphingomonadaceae bacterium]
MNRLLRLALALAAAAWLGVAGLTLRQWHRTAPEDAPQVTVVVPKGASLAQTAAALERAGAIDDARRFRLAARILGNGRPIRAGEYRVPKGAGYAQLLDALTDGAAVQHQIVIPEGLPSVMVADRLAAEPLLTGAVPPLAEGSVLPQGYSFERGEARARVAQRMQAAMAATLKELWPRRSPRTVVKSPAEAVTLASIVEKETGVAAERRMVAAVYSNRLRVGMKLDADPTIIYPITRGRPLGRRILLSEKTAVNGYNTYTRPGLPVGPIANPGRESIAAVLDPAETDALYFVADGKGGHVFAATLAEHQRNVARWFALRRQRGEM